MCANVNRALSAYTSNPALHAHAHAWMRVCVQGGDTGTYIAAILLKFIRAWSCHRIEY